jgi:DNA-directed RNA polymerase specialized sigma24 family protein
MHIASLLRQVDPLIQAIASSYRETISCYDYDDLVQEGRLVVLEALRRYLKKHVEISPASISSWVFIAVNSRLKQLATNGTKMVSCEVFDEDNGGDNANRAACTQPDAGLCQHVSHVSSLTQHSVVTPSLRDFLTTRDVAVSIDRTTQRVVQLQKDFIKD